MPNKHVPETINNLPFLYIKLINDRDTAAIGSLKKAIRLVKNVKNDAENEASAANLPSFDIAALMYHANIDALKIGAVYELSILAEAQRFFDWCHRNKEQAKLLMTPDNTESELSEFTTISVELDSLLEAVAKEHGIASSRTELNDILAKTFVPVN